MNKSSARLVALGLGLLLICGNAAAQGQPIGNGIYACDGAAQAGPCQPEGDDDSSYSSSDGYTDNDYAHAEPKWADRWGAIAISGNGQAGIVTGIPSEAEAQQLAIAECIKRGGSGCSIRRAFHNQCAAVIADPGGAITSSAPTAQKAIEIGMESCRDDGGTECRVYYSGCSLQERVQ